MSDTVKNFAYSTTTAAVTSSATTFSVQTGHGSRFPATGSVDYNLVVYNPIYPNAAVAYQNGACEIVRADALTTDTFTSIVRAQEGTTAIAWGANWRVELNVTAKNFEEASTTVSGLVSISAQSFSGEKSFVSGIAVGDTTDTQGTVTVKDGVGSNTLTLYPPSSFTAFRSQTWQDADGTIALTSDIPSVYNTVGCLFTTSVAAAATRYTAPYYNTVDSGADTNVFFIPSGKTIRRLYVAAKGAGAGSVAVTLRTKAGDSTITCTASYTTSWGAIASDTTHTVTSSTDDFIGFKLVVSTNSLTAISIYCEISN